MVRATVYASTGEPEPTAVARLRVDGQELTIDGNERYVQVGMPVYSPRHRRLIDFDTDPEEWVRNLPSAYRNGATYVEVEDTATEAAMLTERSLAYAHARRG
jgi:hypothetical protein